MAAVVLDQLADNNPTVRASLSSTLFKYVTSEFLLSFLISFSFFFGIFLVNQLIVIARDVLSQQVDVGKALLLLFYSLPAIIAIAFPFGSLVGALLTVGRLGADNEFLAMRAIGYGLRQVFLPIFLASIGLTIFSFTINNIFLPLGTIQYRLLVEKLLYSNTELVLSPFSVTKFAQATIVTDAVVSGNIGALLLFDVSEAGRERVLSAKRAYLDKSAGEAGVLQLKLSDVAVFEQGNQPKDSDVSRADTLSYTMRLQDLSRNFKNVLPSEMSLIDIYKRIAEKTANLEQQRQARVAQIQQEQLQFSQDYWNPAGANNLLTQAQSINNRNLQAEVVKDQDLQIHWVEYWKKISIPAACTTLVLLGIPLGLFARRSVRGIGMGIGLIVAVFFWGGLLLGQFLAVQDLNSSPFLLIWAPNILFVVLGGLAFIPLMRR